MKSIIKFKWPVTIGLLIITVLLFMISPNLSKQAEDAGTFQLPEDAASKKAMEMLNDAGAGEETISLVYSLDEKLTDSAKKDIASNVDELKELGDPVSSVLDPFESKELEAQLVSKDKKTVLVPITVDGTQEEVVELADSIKSDILKGESSVYLTGEAIINNDVNLSAQEGLKRTEIITVVLIFALLLAVFRSIVTPLIPLVAVGITYLLSQSIVAFFIDWFGFPVSNYTQIFLVAILFGIGTDYCILLLSRFKEELGAGQPINEAIIRTYKTAGRTLYISGLAVFIGFFAIGFADFPIFKSAVAVAVGIAVLLLVLSTVMPFFMATLKEKLFWPSKKSVSHNDSKLWAWMGKLSVNRPLLSMAVVAVITVPLLFTYDDALSFNTVDEIGDSYDSVKGLQAIEDGFGQGDSLPVQVLLSSEEKLVTEDDVPYVEKLSRELAKVDGVKSVRSITRPAGDAIEEFNADYQLGKIAEGVNGAADGLDQAVKGFSQQAALAGQGQAPQQGVPNPLDGLNQITGGLKQAGDQLQGMSDSETIRDTGLYLPPGTLENKEFAQVIDRYSFGEEKGLKLEVILSDNPYSPEAIDTVDRINETTERVIKDTPLEDTEVAIGGVSSINRDLSDISTSDFTQTVTIMLISLFVVLAILFRSFIMPLYMIGSLLLTYFTSVAVAEWIFVEGLGYDGISWAVPFFGFVMLVALGVDYSIFLMDRFREQSAGGMTVTDAIKASMAKMGTVIITAAIILAGTFGAMVPSGVLSLVQIATIVITGLLLYGLIVLPLLIPAMTVSFGNGVWWPFRPKKEK
ncbi:MMPL family transporter [Rossellomorea vietnamensis]|uniref:MMPL family transporter n=1 Tax=Rossellomorea vietnamensis TaxID=218284 RepID=UPI001E4DE431|nr:MMPL family transporter [Rossellomorea vietnamensis]MCC5803943.1 MMPL family transporter [Rossellomorea vietnamensis]